MLNLHFHSQAGYFLNKNTTLHPNLRRGFCAVSGFFFFDVWEDLQTCHFEMKLFTPRDWMIATETARLLYSLQVQIYHTRGEALA